jgi:hypothetical protein
VLKFDMSLFKFNARCGGVSFFPFDHFSFHWCSLVPLFREEVSLLFISTFVIIHLFHYFGKKFLFIFHLVSFYYMFFLKKIMFHQFRFVFANYSFVYLLKLQTSNSCNIRSLKMSILLAHIVQILMQMCECFVL